MKSFAKACLGALAGLAFVAGAGAQETKTVIEAGYLLAQPGEGYLKNRTITIEDGRIVRIERGFKNQTDSTKVINLRDAYVIPGLIDSHVHLTSEFSPTMRLNILSDSEVDAALDGASHAKKTLLAGFTTVQDVGGANEAIFSLRDAIRAGKVPGPRIRASGAAITPSGGHGDANGFSPALTKIFTGPNACNGVDDCRRAVRETIRSGADVIKITATGGVLSNTRAGLEQQFFDDEIAAIVETAEMMGRKVTAHAHGKGGIEAALRNGVQSIEHGTYLDDETIDLFKSTGGTLVPTVLAGVTVSGWTDQPWLPAPSREKAAIIGPLMVDMMRRAREGGVKIAFGTDTGVSKHGDNAEEFVLMVEAGFTPEEAIRAATIVAAEHLEMSDQIGTIEEGKFADMVVLEEDPLDDISVLKSVGFVIKNGEEYRQ
ncbi:MAG: amidohydrolase family protein [Henriciella sp.]|nr:amidohydrolase family protein [Henriciella sp.]MBO6694511.1 amidohydrolase family protein [Henriciella sp.]